jgi:uncharacterized protein YegL
MNRRRSARFLVLLFCTFVGFTFTVAGQVSLPGNITLNKDLHDFGDILEGNPRVADYILTNNSSEDVFLLRAEVPDNLVYRYSTQKILPGQSATIRLKYNPDHTGPFHESINLYTSAYGKPFKLYVTGNVKFVDKSDDPSCPNFNDPVAEKQVTQQFTVQVIDRTTMLPIGKAQVNYEPSPNIVPIHLTNDEGICRNTLPIDLYDIDVSAKGYEPSSQTIYVGKNITSTVFLLDKTPQPRDSTIFVQRDEPVVKEPEQPEPRQKDTVHTQPRKPIPDQVITKIDEIFKPKPKSPIIEPDVKKDPGIVFVEKPGELPALTYSPNNIVFLLDVSSSMATPERLPLVKIAMKNLLNSLRSIDRVSIITYASGTTLVLESTPVDDKEMIASKIEKLLAHGTTEGGKGIREAYKIAAQNYIKGGNNQIIIATDGDFNLDKSDDALYRFIQKKAESGISMSVVGVGNIPRALKQMQLIADKGQGSFIHITSATQATGVLVDEIKQRSKK